MKKMICSRRSQEAVMLLMILGAFFLPSQVDAQQGVLLEPMVIQGGTLIDATGRPPLADAVIVIEGDRIKSVGKRGEISIPEGSRIIDVQGKTILPGFTDGHCHLVDLVGEIFLHLGVTTCADITQNDDYWTLSMRDGTNMGKIRGPRIWSTGRRLVGPPPDWAERVGTGLVAKTPEEAREIVRKKKAMGLDILKLNEYVSPEVLKAAADEAHRLGLPVTCHCLDVYLASAAGFAGVEHHWAPGMTSISDVNKRWEIHQGRMSGKIDTGQLPLLYQAENFDKIIQTMVDHNVSWAPTIATWFRPLSPSAKIFRERELSILDNPGAKYLPAVFRHLALQKYEHYEKRYTQEQRDRAAKGYEKIQDFMRRFVKAGGVMRAGSDPNDSLPAMAVHEEMKMFVEAGITPMQAIQAATINPAKSFRKDKDFGTVEPGKVADLVVIEGDPLQDIWATQNVKMVIMNGKVTDNSFHADYKNPIPSPEAIYPGTPDEIEISPRSIPQSAEQATLKVGAKRGFYTFHKVLLNGKELQTKFVSGRELEAVIPPGAIKEAGTYTVVVVGPGEFVSTSQPAYLNIPFKQ
jgi:imidazolonepropionase-like amidohydrolase